MTDWGTLVPDPLSSDRQYNRFYHFDICDLGDIELTDELNYLRPLLWGLPLEHWLRERVAKLEGEMRKRKYDSGSGTSGQRKPKPAEGVKL